MTEALPPDLRRVVTEPRDAELDEDLVRLLDVVVAQNREILRQLNDERAPRQEITLTGAAVFWNSVFSFWGFLVILIICSACVTIFSS